MKGKKLLAGVISAAMLLGSMSFTAFAAGNVAKIGNTEYATFADALTAANQGTGDVTIELIGDAQYAGHVSATYPTTVKLDNNTLTLDATNLPNPCIGVYGNINFVGKDKESSKINIITDSTKSGGDALFGIGWVGNTSSVTMSNLTFDAPTEFNNACGFIGVYNSSSAKFDNVSINAGNNTCTGEYACNTVFYGEGHNAGTTVELNDTTVNVENTDCGFYGFPNASIENLDFEGKVNEFMFSVVSGSVKNSTFKYSDDTTITRSVVRDSDTTINLELENTVFENVPTCTDGVFKIKDGETVLKADERTTVSSASNVTNQTSFVAKIGDTNYATIEQALKAAPAGAEITLLADVEVNSTNAPSSANIIRRGIWWRKDGNVDDSVVINMNRHAVNIKTPDVQYREITFKNGTINVDEMTAPTAVFHMYGSSDLTFDNVEINANKLSGCYLIDTEFWENITPVVTFKNGSKLNINRETQAKLSSVFCTNCAGKLIVENSDINVSNIIGKVILWGDVTIKGNSHITADVVGDGIRLGANASDALKIVASDDGAPVINITVANDDTQRFGIRIDDENVTYTKDDAAVVNATFRRNVSLTSITDKINVFVESAGTNGEYNIVLKADENKKINEFVNAELKIATNAPGYEVVEANDNITIIKNNAKDDVYSFNYTSVQRDVVSEIVIGKIVIPAVGDYKVGVDKTYANKVIATKYNTTDEKEYEGDVLVVADATSATVAQAKRNVKVNIEFEHDINANVAAAYNNMKITIKDVFGGKATENVEITSANAGNVEFTDVPVGLITVTLEAPGFRKYAYQTNLEEGDVELELNFWNSVKVGVNNKVEVNGKVMNHNFLVGDIAMDYVIDDYDLAAVTSYYGTYDINDSNAERLVKYDLNRDGNIDITDVAYVLHSLGY